MKNCKRLASLVLALVLCLSALPLTAQAAGFTRTRTYTPGMFTDVPEAQWYAPYVKDCYELGLISGSSATTFDPQGMYKVCEAITVAARMHKIYNGGSLGDFPAGEPWYQPYVDYCVNTGIITRDQFSSYTRNVTRAEMATLLVTALPDSAWTALNSVSALPDVSNATDYYRDIFTLYNAGVLQGKDDFGTYNPYASVSRAEAATMIAKCANPTLRTSFTLKPLSQRQAPEIIGSMDSYYFKVSNGLMRFYDAETRLYGYMDANTGNISIPAQYKEAKDFSGGYAIVKQASKLGIIDTSGSLILPMSYDYIDSLGYGVYSARVSYSSLRAIVINGRVTTDFVYDRTGCNGIYIFGRTGSNNWDIRDMDGRLLAHINYELSWADKSYLMKAKDGNKWALVSEKGVITDFQYDSIDLIEKYNCTLAKGNIGNRSALLGLNGEVKDLGLDSGCSFRIFNGDYVLVQNGEMSAIADANGIRSSFMETQNCRGLSIWGSVLVVSYWSDGDDVKFVYDASTGKTQTAEGNIRNGFIHLADNTYVTADGTKCSSVSEVAKGYYTFTTQSGKYGLIHNGSVVSEGIYNSPDDAINAYSYYTGVKENGKPVILVGNDVEGKGFSHAIQYYKNDLYYDEIKSVGEGYYACKYNTTWYLVHA